MPRTILILCPAVLILSHPTVGVALFEPKVSDQLGSLCEEPPEKYERFTRMIDSGLAHTSAGRVARTRVPQELHRVRY